MRGKVKIEYAGEFAGTAIAAALIETKPAAKAETPAPAQSAAANFEDGIRGLR